MIRKLKSDVTYNTIIVACIIAGALWFAETWRGYTGFKVNHIFPNGYSVPDDWFHWLRNDNINWYIIPVAFLIAGLNLSWRHIPIFLMWFVYLGMTTYYFHQNCNQDFNKEIYSTCITIDISWAVVIGVYDKFIKPK